MDRFIRTFEAEQDGDLMLCHEHGVAYATDMTPRANYDAAYYDKCASNDRSEISDAINDGRIALVNSFLGMNTCVDIGIGGGEFVRRRPKTFGFDVNPVAEEWLKRSDLWAHDLSSFAGYTFWDVIEHVPEPEVYLSRIQLGAFAFFSIPVVYGLRAVRASKHYRPGEHLYYWTEEGFALWMRMHGFMLLQTTDFEMLAGRESIRSFAFRRFKWPPRAGHG